MRTVHVTRSIPAPAERVFDLLADHAGYARFRGVTSSELLREGDPPPNGVGAFRRVRAWPLRFDEEITLFERPSRFDYRIVDINAPYEHQGASMRFLPVNGGTEVEWTTTFRVPTRWADGVQERVWSLALNRSLRRVLEDAERLLTARG
jgi:uncharacterized protein YndB with AHSA1/START domain